MSFPPRIKCGVNSSGNPGLALLIWIPAYAGMTIKIFYLLFAYIYV